MSLDFYHYSAVQSQKTESHSGLLPNIVLECLLKCIEKYVSFLLVQYRYYHISIKDMISYLATSYGFIVYNTLNTRKMLGGYMHST